MMQSLWVPLAHWLSRSGEILHAFATDLGGPGILLLALADSSFFSIPEGNDLLIVVLCAGHPWLQMIYYVGMTILGSTIGCILLYSAGRKGGSPFLQRRFSKQSIDRVEGLFHKYGALSIIVPSFLPPPCPFKLFVLGAGVFNLKLPALITGVVIGRTIRYSIWGILSVIYGNAAKVYLEENLPGLGIWLSIFFALLIILIVLAGIRRSRQGERAGKSTA